MTRRYDSISGRSLQPSPPSIVRQSTTQHRPSVVVECVAAGAPESRDRYGDMGGLTEMPKTSTSCPISKYSNEY